MMASWFIFRKARDLERARSLRPGARDRDRPNLPLPAVFLVGFVPWVAGGPVALPAAFWALATARSAGQRGWTLFWAVGWSPRASAGSVLPLLGSVGGLAGGAMPEVGGKSPVMAGNGPWNAGGTAGAGRRSPWRRPLALALGEVTGEALTSAAGMLTLEPAAGGTAETDCAGPVSNCCPVSADVALVITTSECYVSSRNSRPMLINWIELSRPIR